MNDYLQNKFTSKAQSHLSLISGYASRFNIPDFQNDIILKGAFDQCISKPISLLWQHNSNMPIGHITSMVEDQYGLFIYAVINKNNLNCSAVASLIASHTATGLSVGFNIISASMNLGRRIIQKVNLIEISVVTNPANRLAKIKEIRQFN